MTLIVPKAIVHFFDITSAILLSTVRHPLSWCYEHQMKSLTIFYIGVMKTNQETAHIVDENFVYAMKCF